MSLFFGGRWLSQRKPPRTSVACIRFARQSARTNLLSSALTRLLLLCTTAVVCLSSLSKSTTLDRWRLAFELTRGIRLRRRHALQTGLESVWGELPEPRLTKQLIDHM